MIPSIQKTSVLAVDVTNQSTQFGLFEDDRLLAVWSITTPARITRDEAWLAVMNFLNCVQDKESGSSLSLRAILSSVVPDLTSTWSEALHSLSGHRPIVVGPGIKTAIQMSYNNPSELGSDRIAAIVAAKKLYGSPLVIIDCGITINYQVLDLEGVYVGGLIVPGLSLSARVLAEATARLPIVELSIPTGILGKNTQESLQSGIVRGEAARINGLIEMISNEIGYEATIVMTGKDAALLAPLLKRDVEIESNLILIGLHELFKMNSRR